MYNQNQEFDQSAYGAFYNNSNFGNYQSSDYNCYNYYNNNNTFSPITNTSVQQNYLNDTQDQSFDSTNYYNYYNTSNYSQYYNNNMSSSLNNSLVNYATNIPTINSNISQLENVFTSSSSSSIENSPTSMESAKTTSSSSLSIISSIQPISKNCQDNYKSRARVATHHQLPEEAVDQLNSWFEAHIQHPYPTTEEKHRLSEECGITVKQVNSWFCNRRNRSQNTKPKRIKRQLEQEISNVFNELAKNPSTQAIEKIRSTLKMHDICSS